MLPRIAVAGSPDDVVSGLAEFVQAGATHLVFTPASRSRSHAVALRIIDEIVPRVRAALR